MNAKKDASPTNESDVINKVTEQETAQKTSATLIKQEKISEPLIEQEKASDALIEQEKTSEALSLAHGSDVNQNSVIIDLDGIKEKKKTG